MIYHRAAYTDTVNLTCGSSSTCTAFKCCLGLFWEEALRDIGGSNWALMPTFMKYM